MTTFQAPTKVCPNCGAQAQTVEDRCPNCNKKYRQKKSHTVRNVLLGIVLLSILAVGGCIALLGSAANEVSKSMDAEQSRSAITTTQWEAIQPGMTKAQVLEIVAPAEPSDEQTMESQSGEFEYNSNCLYFNKAESEEFEIFSYQVCLTDDKVESKNSF
jgi:hypothetical protein